MTWRRATRFIVIGVTLLAVAFALVAGHVTVKTTHHTYPTTTANPCVRLTSPSGRHSSAIKCP